MKAELTIEKLVHGGLGLGRLPSGMVVLVENALPGEEVRLQIVEENKGYLLAHAETILAASPFRTEAPCPHYALCGGCNLQHASYLAQLVWKRDIVIDSFKRCGYHDFLQDVQETLPSPHPFAYRYRLRLHLDEKGQLGFYQRHSKTVEPISRCLLATDTINDLLTELSVSLDLTRLASLVKTIEIAECPETAQLFLSLHPQKGVLPLRSELNDLFYGLDPAIHLLAQQHGKVIVLKGPAQIQLGQRFILNELGLAYTLHWPMGAFFQTNIAQNAQMVNMATKAAGAPQKALDLFCGAGNFSVPLGLIGAKITGIEQNKTSIDFARQNSQDAGLKSSLFKAGEVENELSKLAKDKKTFDCLIMDPPRQGLGKAVSLIPALNPRRIISISCDPATHARDLGFLSQNGYQLKNLHPIDLFPQTHHIETLAILEKN